MNEQELEEITSYISDFPKGMQCTIFRKGNDYYKKCVIDLKKVLFHMNQHWYMECVTTNRVDWLNVGDHFDISEIKKRSLYISFPVLEARKHGFKINCKFDRNIEGYPKLTCDPITLKEIDEISAIGGAGYERIVKKYQCPKCQQYWKIDEEFDSMKGMRRVCKKMR